MTIPATSWDETAPSGSDNLSQGDNKIRELKAQIREVVDIDHQFNSSGQDADNGKHTQVSLLEQADLGTGAEGKPILGAQTTDGRAELMFTNEDNTDIQITDGAFLGGDSTNFTTNDVHVDGTLYSGGTDILDKIYPVGSIYTNAAVSTNPGTLLGFGTWTAFGSGKVLVGLDSGDTDFDTLEETGGAKTHTLTESEMPAHTHTIDTGNQSNATNTRVGKWDGSGGEDTQTTSSTGSGSAHNNVQPYIVVYMWKRTV